MAQDPQKNKANAIAMYELMFNDNKPREAADRYLAEPYTQHNPLVADGITVFVDYFERMAKEYPGKRVEIVHTLAEGDLVYLHAHQFWPQKDGSMEEWAGMDLFRFNDEGRIIEHWDVLQKVPPTSANQNTMF